MNVGAKAPETLGQSKKKDTLSFDKQETLNITSPNRTCEMPLRTDKETGVSHSLVCTEYLTKFQGPLLKTQAKRAQFSLWSLLCSWDVASDIHVVCFDCCQIFTCYLPSFSFYSGCVLFIRIPFPPSSLSPRASI